MSNFFTMITGVRQGYVLVPSCFNTCMDWVLDSGASIDNTKVTDMIFTDDGVILAEFARGLSKSEFGFTPAKSTTDCIHDVR